jgi:hypothetical protein
MRHLLLLSLLLLSACAPSQLLDTGRRSATSFADPASHRLLVGPGTYRLITQGGGEIPWRICAQHLVRLGPDGWALGGTPFDRIAGLRLESGVGRALPLPTGRDLVRLLLVAPGRVVSPDGRQVGDGSDLARMTPALLRSLSDAVGAASGGAIEISVRTVSPAELVLDGSPQGLGPGARVLAGLAIGPDEIPLVLWASDGGRTLDTRALAYLPGDGGRPWIAIPFAESVAPMLRALEEEYLDALERGRRLPDPSGRLRSFAFAGTHELLHVLARLKGVPDETDAASAGYRDDERGASTWGAWAALRFAALDPGADLSVFPSPAEASVARDQSCPERRRADALGLRGE